MSKPEQQWLSERKHSNSPLKKWQRTVNLMAKLFNAPAGFIVQYTANGYEVAVASEQKENPYPAGSSLPLDSNIFCREVIETGNQLYVTHATTMPEWQSNPEVSQDGFNSYLGVLIRKPDGSPFGTICILDYENTSYDNTYIELIHQFRDIVQGDLQLMQQYDHIREQALTDELTGLLNRRGFLTIAEQRMQLAYRNLTPVSLIYLDMDGLKTLNDQKGHDQGDKALQIIADNIRKLLRSCDVSARIGGDEFVIMADTDDLVALDTTCTRICQLFKQSLPVDIPNNVGLSYGVVNINDFTRPLAKWISAADQKMYIHKQSRRLQQ